MIFFCLVNFAIKKYKRKSNIIKYSEKYIHFQIIYSL